MITTQKALYFPINLVFQTSKDLETTIGLRNDARWRCRKLGNEQKPVPKMEGVCVGQPTRLLCWLLRVGSHSELVCEYYARLICILLTLEQNASEYDYPAQRGRQQVSVFCLVRIVCLHWAQKWLWGCSPVILLFISNARPRIGAMTVTNWVAACKMTMAWFWNRRENGRAGVTKGKGSEKVEVIVVSNHHTLELCRDIHRRAGSEQVLIRKLYGHSESKMFIGLKRSI